MPHETPRTSEMLRTLGAVWRDENEAHRARRLQLVLVAGVAITVIVTLGGLLR